MKLRLYDNETVRIDADYKGDLFIDIRQDHYEGLSIDFYPWFCIGEVREKEGQCRLFIFKGEEYRADCDFGWWKDAKIVYSFKKMKPATPEAASAEQ